MKRLGKVYLVGAGPGDPDLLTVKAQRLLAGADAVVYDRLVPPAILDCIRPGAPRIYVGKANGRHTLPQDEINDLLVRLARAGRRVVRLKGGDPFVFGRGSEETAHLARHGVAFEVVPGITAAAGCAAAFGLPLTHRGVANGIRFVTGHACDNAELDLNWENLADPDTTLVVYMGLANIGHICRRLVAAGLAPDTPAFAVSNGTTPEQAACRASLEDLPARIEAVALDSPVVIFIGRAAGLANIRAMTDEDDAAALLEHRGHG